MESAGGKKGQVTHKQDSTRAGGQPSGPFLFRILEQTILSGDSSDKYHPRPAAEDFLCFRRASSIRAILSPTVRKEGEFRIY